MALMKDDGSDVDMGEYMPPSKLPEGVKTEILVEADEKQWRTPKTGDEVKVDYIGCLEDGTEFDSSHSRDAPVVFTLGKGEVIKGWDLAIATMKKGEKTRITLAPEFAYGENGSPPKIPPSATLVFTVELISWVAKDDLFGDGLVTKSQLKEGSGYENPSVGKEVRMNFRVLAENEEKTVLQEKFGFDYVLGSPDLAAFTKVVDKALSGMTKGEIVSLYCEPRAIAGFAPNTSDAVNIELSFEEEYVITDCSFAKDGSVMKKQVKDGESWEKPADGKQITLMVESAKDMAGKDLAGFEAKELKFISGDGTVCDALEMATLDMKKGERALVTCQGAKKSCKEPKLGLGKLDIDTVVLVLEMRDFRKPPAQHFELPPQYKVEEAEKKKEKATALFKAERYSLALEKYKKVVDTCKETKDWPDEAKARAKELTKACNLNKSACYLKLGDDLNVLGVCNDILKTDTTNVKALFRRAKAHFNRNELIEAQMDLDRLLEIDENNAEAKALVPHLKRKQKSADKESKNAFKDMMKAFGKMPERKENQEPKPHEPEPEVPKSDQVDVIFKMEYEPKEGEKIFVYGGPEVLGAWDESKAVSLRLHTFQPPPHIHGGRIPPKIYTWEAVVQVPEYADRCEYKYIVRGPDGDKVEPGKHAVQLGGMGGSRQKCQDSWRKS